MGDEIARPTFQWTPGDEDFHFEILEATRLPLLSSMELQGRYAPWQTSLGNGFIPNLRGRSLHEVEDEAKRIKTGKFFTSFKVFDRCLHSWYVLSRQACNQLKTRKNVYLRVCRFGPNVRKLWRSQDAPNKGAWDGPHREDMPCTGPCASGPLGDSQMTLAGEASHPP